MSKVIRTAAIVVGAVVAIAAAIPTGGTSLLAATLGVSTAAGTAIAAGVSLATTLISAVTAKIPGTSISGNQTKFTASTAQGLPYALGRTAVSGWLIHKQTWDWSGSTDNAFQTFFGIWSAGGPIQGLENFQVDGTTVAFTTPVNGGQAQGGFHDWMWLSAQKGECPEPDAMTATGFFQYPSGWTAQSKLSGYAAFAWTLKFDTKGKIYPGGAVPAPREILYGVKVYDPRQDSTYPGGSGPCRAGDESTYVWDGADPDKPAGKNGALHALTWALGRWQNAKRVLGIGMAIAAIDVPAFVQAANVADANGWTCGGVVYSTDGKWDVLKKMLLTCSGEPLQLGGVLSCVVDTPRVSLATITDEDIIGKCTVPATARIRDRINGVIPTFRSETHDWQLVPATQVTIADYVAADRRPRTKAITWELVQDANQVAELAAYYICNSREIDGVVLPLKLRWIGYKPGDAITVASSTVGMESQLCIIRRRHLDPSSGAVTMTLRSETTGKHAFALGKTTTPPPTPALQAVDRTVLLIPGVSASWSAVIDDDGNRPADGATVGAPAGTKVVDRNAEDVLATIDINAEDIVGINSRLTTVEDTNGTLTTKVNTLSEVYINSDGTAKALYTLETSIVGSGGRIAISGFSNSVDATGSSTFDILAGHFSIVDPGDGTPHTVFDITDGLVRMHTVEVDTLKINTAIVPVRAAATSAIAGTHTGGHGTVPTPAAVLSTTIVMPVAGWIEVSAAGRQTLGTIGNTPWLFQIEINGTALPESVFGGENPGDSTSPLGAMFVDAGTYTVELLWNAHTSITLTNRSMFVKGFPSSE